MVLGLQEESKSEATMVYTSVLNTSIYSVMIPGSVRINFSFTDSLPHQHISCEHSTVPIVRSQTCAGLALYDLQCLVPKAITLLKTPMASGLKFERETADGRPSI